MNFASPAACRNLRDGRVEVVCEGTEEDIGQLVEWCKRGPQGAVVEHVDVAWKEYTGEFKEFQYPLLTSFSSRSTPRYEHSDRPLYLPSSVLYSYFARSVYLRLPCRQKGSLREDRLLCALRAPLVHLMATVFRYFQAGYTPITNLHESLSFFALCTAAFVLYFTKDLQTRGSRKHRASRHLDHAYLGAYPSLPH